MDKEESKKVIIVDDRFDSNLTLSSVAKACDAHLKESEKKVVEMENKLRSDELKSSKEVPELMKSDKKISNKTQGRNNFQRQYRKDTYRNF